MDAASVRATGAVPGIPRDEDGPVFREPWEAHAFAMALALHDRGLFTWNEWAAALADEIKRAQAAGDPDTGETYYRHWLATLEHLVDCCHGDDRPECPIIDTLAAEGVAAMPEAKAHRHAAKGLRAGRLC
jgi:nitrile hydratase accessory protein